MSAVVTPSRWTRRWLLDAYGLDAARVAVAVPGVEPARVVAVRPDGRRLICVGAVVPAKGHDVLLEALARVPVAGWTLECVGTLERDPAFVDGLNATSSAFGSPAGCGSAAPWWALRSTPPTPVPTSWSARPGVRRTAWS